MSSEPRLSDLDHEIWADYRDSALLWSKSRAHRTRVERAAKIVRAMHARAPRAFVSWSAGKDSTALAHLVATELGPGVEAVSIKDDLDFPGEEEYLARWTREWGIVLSVIRPDFSLESWLRERGADLAEDLHSRASEFSQAAFYDLINRAHEERRRPGCYLGLRAEESAGRLANRRSRGTIYEKRGQGLVACPLSDWEGIDVFAYLLSRGIDPLPVYRCVRLDGRDPSRVRKSWWVPGAHSNRGAAIWLRTYYPSLYQRLLSIDPTAAAHAH